MLLDTVRKTIDDNLLLKGGGTVICAVSGGADSMCLLHVMLSLRKEYNLNLVVANVNHMIRGEEANRDSEFVKSACASAGIVCYYREYDVPSIARQRKIGEEECGRILRYEFFNEVAENLGGAKIATAHNLNDNAETVLFRLARGSSAQGLSGIKYMRGNIIRPLLDVKRNDIEEFLRMNNINWCEDSTNKVPVYARNKIRISVMPLFEEIFPATQEKIVSAAKLISEDNAFLDSLAENVVNECYFEEYFYTEPVNVAALPVKRRAVAEILGKWGLSDITADKVEAFLAFLHKDNGKRFNINSSVFAEKNYDRISLRKYSEQSEFSDTLDIGKDVYDKHWRLTAEYAFSPVKKNSNNIAVFDADKIQLPLVVRYRRDGDKISPKGMSGTKKISDIFTDAKIDRFLRDNIPVVENGTEIVYIGGIRQSSLYDVDSNTNKYLIIKYTKER